MCHWRMFFYNNFFYLTEITEQYNYENTINNED